MGLPTEVGGHDLVELHQEVAEVDEVLRPAALVAGLTLLEPFEVRETSRPARQGLSACSSDTSAPFSTPL